MIDVSSLTPDQVFRWHEANAATDVHDYQKADLIYSTLIDEGVDVLCGLLGWVKDKLNQPEAAFIYYEKGAQLGYGDAMYYLACNLALKQDYDAAIIWYQKAVGAGRFECFRPLAEISIKKGDYQNYISYLKEGMGHDQALCARDLALFYVKGKAGFFRIFEGLLIYAKWIPAIVRQLQKDFIYAEKYEKL